MTLPAQNLTSPQLKVQDPINYIRDTSGFCEQDEFDDPPAKVMQCRSSLLVIFDSFDKPLPKVVEC